MYSLSRTEEDYVLFSVLFSQFDFRLTEKKVGFHSFFFHKIKKKSVHYKKKIFFIFLIR